MGSPDFKQALLERLLGENQMDQAQWTKLWYDPFDPLTTPLIFDKYLANLPRRP
jgi:hypothetical protein